MKKIAKLFNAIGEKQSEYERELEEMIRGWETFSKRLKEVYKTIKNGK